MQRALEATTGSTADSAKRDAARALAHRIRGTAGTFGFSAVGDAAARIDDALIEVDARRLSWADAWAALNPHGALNFAAHVEAAHRAVPPVTPVGVLTRCEGGRLTLEGVVLSRDGQERIIAQATSTADTADAIGRAVAHLLMAQGAHRLMGDTVLDQ